MGGGGTLKPIVLCARIRQFSLAWHWHWGMGPSVKHVSGFLEWSYVVPEKPFLLTLLTMLTMLALLAML